MAVSSSDEIELLRQQLRELGARVARLEAERVGATPLSPPRVAELAATAAGQIVAAIGAAQAEPQPLPVTPPPIPAAAPWTPGGSASRDANDREGVDDGKQNDLEHFFALTVLGRVGIAAVVLAAAYFGQLGWVHLGPAARAALVYVFGGLLIAVGALLRHRVEQRYIALLWGGGVAVTYLASVLAHLRYAVMPAWLALTGLLLTAGLGQLLAQRLRLQLLATVALAGAYAAPVIVGTPSPTPTAFFVLLLSLHSWAAWTEHRWQWLQARAVAVVLTLLLVFGWYVQNGTVSALSFFLHLHAVWLLLALPELLRAAWSRPVSGTRVYAVFLLGLVFGLATTNTTHWRADVALWLGCGWLLAGALYVPRHERMGQFLARIPAFVLVQGVFVWWLVRAPDDHSYLVWTLVTGLVAVGALQLLVRRWTRVGDLGLALAAGAIVLANAATSGTSGALTLAQAPIAPLLPLLLLVFASHDLGRVFGLLLAVAASLVAILMAHESPIRGEQLVALALVTATAVATLGSWLAGRVRSELLGYVATAAHALLVFAWLVYCVDSQHYIAPPSAGGPDLPIASSPIAFWNVRFLALVTLVAAVAYARRLLPPSEVQQRAVLGSVLLIACYVGGLLEVLDIIRDWTFGPHAVATSLYSLLFASLLLLLGFWQGLRALRWAALILFGGVAVKVAVYDLSQATTPVRVLVTGILGGVLLVVAWGYARRKPPQQ